MTNGYKRHFVMGRNGTEYTELGVNDIYTIDEMVGPARNNRFHERVRIKNDDHLAQLILELLNNPPDPFKKNEEPLHQTAFTAKGKHFTIRGSKEACDIVDELVKFFIDQMQQHGFVAHIQDKPRVSEQPEVTYKHYNPADIKELFHRLGEVERNLYALSAQRNGKP